MSTDQTSRSRNAKRIRVLILDAPDGTREHTSLAHARRHVKKGIYEWADPDRGEWCRQIRRCRLAAHPMQGPRFDLVDYRPSDSMQAQTFLRYPQPSMLTSGVKYPALARQGAGL